MQSENKEKGPRSRVSPPPTAEPHLASVEPFPEMKNRLAGGPRLHNNVAVISVNQKLLAHGRPNNTAATLFYPTQQTKLQPNKCKPRPLFFIKCFGVDFRPIQMHSVLPVPAAADLPTSHVEKWSPRLIQWEQTETPSPTIPWRPPQQKFRLAASQLVLLSLPQISLVSGVNPSLTLMNRRR